MSVIDTHCHLDIVAHQGITIENALREAREIGVDRLVQIATGLQSSRFNRELALEHKDNAGTPRIYWTAGLHPEAANDISDLDELMEFVKENRDEENFLGIGETGLDYFHTTEYVVNQKTSLERHLELAKELKLPIVLHLRDGRHQNSENVRAVQDALEIIKSIGVQGVLHCFTYGYEEAKPFVDLGWMVSYSGILTFKNARPIQDGAARLPLDCLMVETDAPFLAPAPNRGKTNQPAYVVHTLEYLIGLRAERCDEDPEEVRARILSNSEKFLNWKHTL